MRLFYFLFILWLNLDESLQQSEIRCRLTLPPLEGTTYEPGSRNLFTPGETLRVLCGERYWISNHQTTSVETTCKEDGEWTVRPVCKEIICSNRREPNVYYWPIYWNQQHKIGSTLRYRCNRGYKNTDGASVATCTRDGWSPKPLCTEITCARRDFPEADITTNNKEIYKYYEHASYDCKEGYRGRFELTCYDSGWRGEPQCSAIMCNRPYYQNAVINGTALSQYKYNEQLDFVCKTGYEGRFTVTCKEGGWIGSRKCTKKECKRLDIDGAYIYRNDQRYYSHGAIVQYVCLNDGDRRFTVICDQDVWTGIESCTEKQCKRLDIDGAYIYRNDQRHYSHDDTVQYVCLNDGDRRFTVTCNQGVWTGIESCTDLGVGCETPPSLADGDIKYTIKDQYSHRETVEYMCQKYYTMEGNPNRTCINGEWTGHMRCLKPCIVDEDIIRQQNITLKSNLDKYFAHDEIIEFECTRGIPVGAVALRQRCNGGVLLLPTCQ